MIMKEMWKGTGVALVTPFLKNGSVDFEGLEKLVKHVIDGGLNYLVVLGTTGETATLSKEEQASVLQHVKRVNNGRLPIVLGVGGNNTQAVIDGILNANLEGVSAILSASPYYNKPSQEGIYQHYAAISAASPLPIILYNVPGRTASNMNASTTLRLANDFKNILGIKEASADMDQVMEIIKNKPSGFFLTSGEDALAFPITLLGGVGVISVTANAYPLEFSNMINCALNGEVEEGRTIHYQLLEFIHLLFEEGNPGGIKSALANLSICEENMRLPLWPVSEKLRLAIKDRMKEMS